MTGEQKHGGLEVVAWPVVTDQWAETYCELTGRDPDGQQVTFVDGGTVTTFRDMARREIEAMLCAAPKSAVRTIATAEPAEARIRELRDERDTAQSAVEAWAHVCESLEAHLQDRIAMRDEANPERYLSILRSSMARVQRDSEQIRAARWADYRCLTDRATAAEAKLARAVEGLERIVHWRVEMTGTPVDTEAANAWALTFDTAATEASQTLAALQQEGE